MMVCIQNTHIMWQFPTKSKKVEKPEPPLIYYNVYKTRKQGMLELKDENMTYLNFYEKKKKTETKNICRDSFGFWSNFSH